jgi:hypothetical protein
MKRLLLALASVPTVLAAATPAHASFASPAAFEGVFNRLDWGSSRVTLSNAGQCRSWAYSDFPDWWHSRNVFYGGYSCRSGWITIRNPQGTRVCAVLEASYNGQTDQYTYTTRPNCRWK